MIILMIALFAFFSGVIIASYVITWNHKNTDADRRRLELLVTQLRYELQLLKHDKYEMKPLTPVPAENINHNEEFGT